MSQSALPLLNIHYISYGITKTGGYRHEKFLYKETLKYFRKSQITKGYYYRKNKLFTHFFAYMELLIWAILKSGGHINIVTAKTGLSAILRNWFTKNEVWIVMHNYDPQDGKTGRMKIYYDLLFRLLTKVTHTRFKVITGASFFLDYFGLEKGLKSVFLFPNFFDTDFYRSHKKPEKQSVIFMGQWSAKNDPSITILARRLNEKGYYCYFSTLNPQETMNHNGSYAIVSFSSFGEYLERMSECCCTLALVKVNEGWNRVAHESLLVGTPVIGYANGGLGDLLKESNSAVVGSIDEAYERITGGNLSLPDQIFIDKYDIRHAEEYLDKLCRNLSFPY